MLITEHIAWKSDAMELAAGDPGLLLAAAHSVLSYFYDNVEALRAEVDRRSQYADEMARNSKQLTREQLLKRFEARQAAGNLP